MKRFTLFIVLIGLASLLMAQSEQDPGKINYNLLEVMEQQPVTYHPVHIIMADRLDMVAMNENFNKLNASREVRTYTVITSLKAKAAATQPAVLNFLKTINGVEKIRPYWIANMIYAELSPQAISALSLRSDIEEIQLYIPPVLEKLKEPLMPAPKRVVGGREPGHDAINAPAMWALGYTGNSRKALIIDSGAQPDHPALAANYHGNYAPAAHSWFNYNPIESPRPFDCDNMSPTHGTHVSGTLLGLDRNTKDTIGVAFNATWMVAAEIGCGTNNNDGALQWAIDPDNDPNTIDDQPDVINNSWGSQVPATSSDCNGGSQMAINAVEAAGIPAVTSAGNLGGGSSTHSTPAVNGLTLVNSFSVGAINPSNLNLAGFSSRGPSVCNGLTGSLLIKPEVVAPGVNTRSSISGGYALFPGTSMASPHVAGAIILLREAFPAVTGENLKLALYNTAIDLGVPGEDNNYGMGLIDVLAAYNYLITQGNTPVPPPNLGQNVSIHSVIQQNEEICGTEFIPEITLRNDGSTTLSSVDLSYEVIDGQSGTFQWTGSLAAGQTQVIQLPALSNMAVGRHLFEVSIDMVDGVNDEIIVGNFGKGSVIMSSLEEAESDAINVCSGFPGLLSATYSDPDAILRWFPNQTSTEGLGDGFQFFTPPLTGTESFYIGVIKRGTVGLPDNSAPGFNLPATGNYLIFNAYMPFNLKSVKVYATGAGNRSIQLKNSNGSIIESKIIFIPDGESRVELNMDVPEGQSLQLSLEGALSNLWVGTGVVTYPFKYENVVDIIGSNTGLYNHFYDWEVEYEISCTRAFTFATVSGGSVVPAFTPSTNNIDISQAASVSFANNSSGGTSYLWSFGDGTTSTAANPSHNYTAPGVYTVGLSVAGSENCSAATSTTITVTGEYPYNVGIKDDLANIGLIDIIPNPNNGQFHVLFDLNQRIEAEVEVFDLVGKRILNIDARSYQQGKLDINLQDYSDGIYYLKVHFEGNQIVKKLVVRND